MEIQRNNRAEDTKQERWINRQWVPEWISKKTKEGAEKLGEMKIHWLLQGEEGSTGSRTW